MALSFQYVEVFYKRKQLYSTLGYKSSIQLLDSWFIAQKRKKLVV
jgi:hypothetical protein